MPGFLIGKVEPTPPNGQNPVRLVEGHLNNEDSALFAASSVPRRRPPAQLQRRGARPWRVHLGGEPGGAAARGAAPRDAPRAQHTQRVADRRRAAFGGERGTGGGTDAGR